MHPIVRGTGLTLVFMLGGATIAGAQDADAPRLYDTTGTHWVYASYYKVPWSRVDSLLKLERFRPAWRARAIAMGCFVDSQLLIHQTGNEYNVVTSTAYSSYRDFGPGGRQSGCAARAWSETIPDSTLRASITRGREWVFGDLEHYDVIYWVPYPSRQ